MTPAVSVLMAAKDADYLDATLRSLTSQTLTAVEIVLVDDAADDGAQAAMARWAENEPRLRLIRNDRRLGLPAALNRGLAACRAPLIARADNDDLHHPERLARQVAEMARRPALGALSCGFRRIDAQGALIDVKPALTGADYIRFRMLFSNSLLHPGAVIRAELLRRLGGWDERYWTAQDSDLWARMAEFAALDNLPEPLVDYRVHDRSVVRTRGEAGRALSLSVPGRLQAAYLGAAPAPGRLRATVDAFQSHAPQELATLVEGARGLGAIWRAATEREDPAVLRRFRDEAAAAFLKQARWGGARRGLRTAFALAATAFWRFKRVETWERSGRA